MFLKYQIFFNHNKVKINPRMEPGMPLSSLPLTTMSSTLDDYCKNPTPLNRPLTAGSVDYVIQHYIFPIQFIFGVCGNSLNLLVLLSSSMKNQVCLLFFLSCFFFLLTVIFVWNERNFLSSFFRLIHSSQQWHLLT